MLFRQLVHDDLGCASYLVGDEEEFVRRALATLGPQPPNFQNIVALNRGPLVLESVDAHPLTPRQIQQAHRAGAMVVDVRTELQFDEAHIPGAVSNTILHSGFGTRLAWIAGSEDDIVLVGRDDADALHAALLAAAVGASLVQRYGAHEVLHVVDGGVSQWMRSGWPVVR